MPIIYPTHEQFLANLYEFKTWTVVKPPEDRCLTFVISEAEYELRSQYTGNRKIWIDANCKSRVITTNHHNYWFDDPTEAMLFKLVVDTL